MEMKYGIIAGSLVFLMTIGILCNPMISNGDGIIDWNETVLNYSFDWIDTSKNPDEVVDDQCGLGAKIYGYAAQDSSGKVGKSMTFDGDNSYLRRDYNSNLDILAYEGLTLSAWVYIESTPAANENIVSLAYDDSGPRYYSYGLKFASNGRVTFIVDYDDSQQYVTSDPQYYGGLSANGVQGSVPLNTWTWICGVMDKDTDDDPELTIYINGYTWNKVDLSGDGELSYDDNDLYIGIYQNMGCDFDGEIDEVTIYDRDCTPNEILRMYRYAGAAIYHSFDNISDAWQSNDESGHGITGEPSSVGVYDQNGYDDDCIELGGNPASDYFEIGREFLPDTCSLHDYSELTISLWIKPNGVVHDNHDNVISKIYGTGGQPYYSWCIKIHSSLKIELVIATSTSASESLKSEEGITADTWTHVVGTYDGTDMKLYINYGTYKSKSVSATIPYNDEYYVNIGRYTTGTNEFDGFVDDVAIYPYAISATDVYQLYAYT